MRPHPDIRSSILDSAQALISDRGVEKATVADIAASSGCAKGLVHYHFGTKAKLVAEVAQRVVHQRAASWTQVLGTPSPQEAIDTSWGLLTSEAEDGTVHTWAACVDRPADKTDQSVTQHYESFNRQLGQCVESLLLGSGLRPSVPASELGALLGGVIHGIGKMLVARVDTVLLEAAYAAAWIGILSLTEANI